MRLFERVDLGYVLRRMRELERDALAMPESRKPPILDQSNFVQYVGMQWIMLDNGDAGLWHDLARLVFLRHGVFQGKLIDDR